MSQKVKCRSGCPDDFFGETAAGVFASYWLHWMLVWIMQESAAPTADMGVLPGVLLSRTLLRTVHVRLDARLCGCPVSNPSSRSRDTISCVILARKIVGCLPG